MKSSMYKSSSNENQSSMYKSARNQFSLPKISNSKEKILNSSRYNNNNTSKRGSFARAKNKSLNELP
jgi:hypothetical protein